MTPEEKIEEAKHRKEITSKYWKGWLSVFVKLLYFLIPLQLLVLLAMEVWHIWFNNQ